MRTYLTRSLTQKSLKTLHARTKAFESSFFPHCSKKWYPLFLRLRENSVFAVQDINRLRLNFSHENEHKFQHNFNNTINPMCPCGKEPETTLHYLSHSNFYSIYRLELLNDICALNHSLKNMLKENLLKVLLYGEEEFSFKINSEI